MNCWTFQSQPVNSQSYWNALCLVWKVHTYDCVSSCCLIMCVLWRLTIKNVTQQRTVSVWFCTVQHAVTLHTQVLLHSYSNWIIAASWIIPLSWFCPRPLFCSVVASFIGSFCPWWRLLQSYALSPMPSSSCFICSYYAALVNVLFVCSVPTFTWLRSIRTII